ncbi:MAG: 4Fe-4S dicluster domain-containing protein [Bacteroidota bacterium]
MRYGFVIDNRKCIGCHACTTACKSEHNVPVGVNRTWVKQVEKGVFPDTRRLFSVLRCNHCTDAPCVEICPTEALYYRNDGIVDFDKDRCIGCKSCMQACPYDALYIDPETHTAAKCNYCAHRIDVGLEPACVNVCPEHAIISGDMENPNTEIAELLARQQVSVRKYEKGTNPNLFYIDADEASLTPAATPATGEYFWNSQTLGVGHFAKEAEKMAFSNGDVVTAVMEANNQYDLSGDVAKNGSKKSVAVLMGKEARRIYDTPNKGVLWGWEVSGYVWTKAIAAGVFLVAFMKELVFDTNMGSMFMTGNWMTWGILVSLAFLVVTGLLLIKDLDQPKRFLYVLLRPQWSSWLVKGGYAITAFGGLLTLILVAFYFRWFGILPILKWACGVTAVFVASYTAFLFAQAKGRDFWQSPSLALHMILHAVMAGAAFFAVLNLVFFYGEGPVDFLKNILYFSVGLNLLTIFFEIYTPHPTKDAKTVVDMITKGRYAKSFWGGAMLLGNVMPLVLLIIGFKGALPISGVLVLVGILILEKIWVEAPQRIPLT